MRTFPLSYIGKQEFEDEQDFTLQSVGKKVGGGTCFYFFFLPANLHHYQIPVI